MNAAARQAARDAVQQRTRPELYSEYLERWLEQLERRRATRDRYDRARRGATPSLERRS
ncbi:MAG TPA: hypothetical protein VF032_19555 [Thermoleophilaceae bacterium]